MVNTCASDKLAIFVRHKSHLNMFGKLQETQRKMEEIKQRLSSISVTAEVEGGAIQVTATADRRIQEIHVADALLHDKEQLELLLITATNKALEQADKVAEAEMQAAARDLLPGGLAGLGNLFGK